MANSGLEYKEEVDANTRYEQLGEAWRQVVGWRSTIFAGYIVSIGAIGYQFLQTHSEVQRLALLFVAIVAAVIFQLLEIRVRGVGNQYQFTGFLLEKDLRGCYMTMEDRIDDDIMLTKPPCVGLITFGLPVTILTTTVFFVAGTGILHYWRAAQDFPITAKDVCAGTLAALFSWVSFGYLLKRQRQWEKKRKDKYALQRPPGAVRAGH